MKTTIKTYEDANGNTVEQEVFVIPALIKRIGSEIRKLKNDKETPFYTGDIEIVYPATGVVDTINCRFYKASVDKHDKVFVEGATIEAHIEAKGEFAGLATAHLPAYKKADMSQFVASTKATTKKVEEEEEIELE